MLGVQKSWLSGSSVSAIFLVKTLSTAANRRAHVADRQTELVSNMPIFFFATTALTLTLMYVVLCNILSILHNT